MKDLGGLLANVQMEGGQLLNCTVADNSCPGLNQRNPTSTTGMPGGGINYEAGAITNCIAFGSKNSALV